MLPKLILLELRKRRNAILGWGIGLALFAMMIMSIAPSLAEQFSQLDLSAIPIYQAFGITENIDSATSLLGVYLPFFGLMLAVYGAITGANALAGEEDSGTLEMLLTLPVKRHLLVIAKAIAILLALFLISMFTFVGFAVFFPSVSSNLDTTLTLADFFNVSWEMVPLAFAFAMLTLFLGALLPSRGMALGVGVAILIIDYLLDNMAGVVDALKDVQPLSLFYYYNGEAVLDGDLDILRVITLLIVALVCIGLAIVSFQRRDVTTGAWPWARRQRPAEATQ